MAFQGKSILNTRVSKRKRNQLSQKRLQQLIEQGIPLQKKLDISESASIDVRTEKQRSALLLWVRISWTLRNK